jgi:hypothetical protein
MIVTARVASFEMSHYLVIPAQAGIQGRRTRGQVWMPAFAGMTLAFIT